MSGTWQSMNEGAVGLHLSIVVLIVLRLPRRRIQDLRTVVSKSRRHSFTQTRNTRIIRQKKKIRKTKDLRCKSR